MCVLEVVSISFVNFAFGLGCNDYCRPSCPHAFVLQIFKSLILLPFNNISLCSIDTYGRTKIGAKL